MDNKYDRIKLTSMSKKKKKIDFKLHGEKTHMKTKFLLEPKIIL